jgi:uncharacterized LabA/DUF88 family protein
MANVPRVMFFIDGNNLYRSFKDLYGDGKCDLRALVEAVLNQRTLVEVGFYIGKVKREGNVLLSEGQQRFLDKVKNISGFRVWLGHIQHNYHQGKGEDIYKEKGVDVRIATHLLTFSDKYETGVIVSADSDLVPAVLEAKKLGKRIENAFPWERKSWHLFQNCDAFWDIKRVSWNIIAATKIR